MILWIAGLAAGWVILYLWSGRQVVNMISVLGKEKGLAEDNYSADLVNNLLMSSEDPSISGSINFIKLNISAVSENNSEQNKKLYNDLLNQKLKRITGSKRPNSAFDIRPVPK